MRLFNRWLLAAAAACLVAPAPVARAQEASLAVVPSKAPIVVQLNGYERARDRLGKFLGNSLPDVAPKLAKQVDDALREVTQGRDLKGLVKDGRIYVAVADLASLTDQPQVVVLLPVSSYKEFTNGFLKDDEKKSLKGEQGYDSVKLENQEDTFYLVDRKNYVAATNDKDLAKGLAKGDDAGLGKALSKETAQAFLAQDVSAYVNLQMINKQYGAQIKQFKALIDLALQGGGGMGLDKKQAEKAKQIFNGLLQVLDDGTAAVIGLDFRPEGANLHLSAQFRADSETNDFLKQLKPSALGELGGLPGGRMMYTASNFDPNKSKFLTALAQSALAEDMDEDAGKGIKEAIKDLSEAGRIYEVAMMKSLSDGMEVYEYKDGPKAVAAMTKMFKSLSKSGSFANVPLKDKPVLKQDAETVGGLKLNLVKFSFDFDKAVENLPEQIRESTKATMMKVAGEKTNVWYGNNGNQVIVVTGKDFTEARTALEEFQKQTNPLQSDESFAVTRKQLPKDATMLMLGDTARFLEAAMSMIKESAAGVPGFPGGGIPDLKAPKGKPAYFGAAVVMKDGHTGLDVFVPTTAVQQVRKMFAPLIDGDN